MPITGLSLKLDRATYVRLDPSYATLRAFVTATAGTGSDVQVTLTRKRAYGSDLVATNTLVGVGATMVETSFDLAALLTADGLPAVIRSRQFGDYVVEASVVGAPAVKASVAVTVLLIAPEVMRRRWLMGLPLTQTERKTVRAQPQAVTGVTVVGVGTKAATGAGTLGFTSAGTLLTWRGGAAVAVPAGVSRLVLVSATNVDDYIVVETDSTKLPGGNASETLIVDFDQMTDDDLARRIHGLVDETEKKLFVPLEPRRVVSRMLVEKSQAPASYDRIVDGQPWYRLDDRHRWINVPLPFPHLLKVHTLSGWLNQQRSLVVDAGWMQVNEKSGEVNLIPSTTVALEWLSESPLWPSMLFMQPYIPGWWQFDVTHGLREIPPGLIEHVAKLIAIDLLTSAGQARNPSGVAGASLSRDGISESRSLNPLGLYAATIQRYLDETGQGALGRGTSTDAWRELLIGIPISVL